MAYGLEVRNESDFVQVDGSTQHWAVIQRGWIHAYSWSAYFATSPYGANIPYTYFPNVGTDCLIAVRPPYGYVISIASQEDPSLINGFKLICLDPNGNSANNGWECDCEYAVLAPSPSVPAYGPAYGLQIFNESSSEILDSRKTLMQYDYFINHRGDIRDYGIGYPLYGRRFIILNPLFKFMFNGIGPGPYLSRYIGGLMAENVMRIGVWPTFTNGASWNTATATNTNRLLEPVSRLYLTGSLS